MKPPFSLLRRALRNPNPSSPKLLRSFSLSASPSPSPQNPTPRVAAIVDEIANLTLVETSDLTHLLVQKLSIDHMPTLAVISAGMSFSGVAGAPSAAEASEEGEKKEEKEKTAFDVKLEGFDASAKIKVIKEVRAFTNLGLKEAKELVEKAPVVVKGGVAKEEAEKILEKLKEIGAKAVLE